MVRETNKQLSAGAEKLGLNSDACLRESYIR